MVVTCFGERCCSINETIRYHLEELAIARNPSDPRYAMPSFVGGERVVVDIGCGIGQTFVAAHPGPGTLPVGVDIDFESLVYGRRHYKGIFFVNATAENLPFKSGTVDLAFSRVSLPYTHIPRAAGEIGRVLRPGGRTWLVLHPPGMGLRHLGAALARGRVKESLYAMYVLINGAVFHCFGVLFHFPTRRRRMESFQTRGRTRRVLASIGFENIGLGGGRELVATATKRPGAGAGS
ncbi:MAG: methyltransferase domain-containing protein [Chitinivibrionales bacterium]|nr:methyltransferase domain-containing protein [Chitinivibrionales bacterium]MBD3395915.1 methyltransferase domain-containing protein [Chitinivibrionales bacterium]